MFSVEGVQHEPVENVQKPVEGVHDPVEGIHEPVEGVHDPVEGIDAVEGVVDAFALPLLLALSFLSALPPASPLGFKTWIFWTRGATSEPKARTDGFGASRSPGIRIESSGG